MTDTENRLQVLEETLAHQETRIEDLSEMLKRQWDLLEAMKIRLDRSEHRMQTLEDDLASPPEANVKPPHY